MPLLFTVVGDHRPGELRLAGRKMLEVMLSNGIKVSPLLTDRAYTPRKA